MEYIRDHNRDTNVNFDIVEEPVSKWGRGRGGGREGGEVRGRGQANDRGRGRGRGRGGTRGVTRGATRGSGESCVGTRGATRGTGQGLGGQGGINMKQVLSNAHKTRINEEEREYIQNVLSVLSPKQLDVRNTTRALPQIAGHAGYYCCLCETSFSDDDDKMVDNK